ncbi:hypothetical protein M9458_030543, partial [Cirrhinus mrigala]
SSVSPRPGLLSRLPSEQWHPTFNITTIQEQKKARRTATYLPESSVTPVFQRATVEP